MSEENTEYKMNNLKPLFIGKINIGYRVTYKKKIIEITDFEIRKDKILVVGNFDHTFHIDDLANDAPNPLKYIGFQAICVFFGRIQEALNDKQKNYIDKIFNKELSSYDISSFFN